MYALQHLFDKGIAARSVTDSGKGMSLTIKGEQPRLQSSSKLAISGSQENAPSEAWATQPRIAWVTLLVTPKLPWRL